MEPYNGFTDPNTFSMGTSTGVGPLQATATNAQANGGYQPVTVSTAATNVATGGAVDTPGVKTGGDVGGMKKGPGFFGEGGVANLALGAIETLGSLWNSFQQNKLAKKSFALQERAFETNLANQTKTYNTALEDRINARYATEGRSEQAASYIEKNRL